MHKFVAQVKSMPKILLRMFIYNYLFFLSLFLVIFAGIWGFTVYQRNQIFKERAMSHCQALSEYFDSLFSSFNRLSITVGHNERLRALSNDPVSELDFNVLDSTRLFSAQRELISPLAMDSSIANLAIYLFGKDYVISSYGTSTLDSFYQSLFSMEPNVLSEYLRPLNAGTFLFLPRSENNGTVLSQNSVYVISLVDTNGTRYGNLFVFLDDREIQQHLEGLLDSNENYYIFTDQGENVLKRGTATDEKELTASARNMTWSFFCHENKSGWKFYVGSSPEYIKMQILFITLILTFLYFVTALLGIPMVFSLCQRNYKPIRELTELIAHQNGVSKTARSGKKGHLEYETLKLAISSIFKDKNVLEEQLEIYKPVLINSLLLQLLEGSGSSNSILKGLETLGTPVPFSWFLCVSLHADSIHQEALISGALSIREKEDVSCLFVSMDKHTGYYLVNASSCEDCRLAALTLADFLDHSDSVTSTGIGRCSDTISGISESYHQAREALDYLNVCGQSKCVVWESLKHSSYHNPPFTLEAFSSQLLSGQLTEADKELQKYWEKSISHGFVHKSSLDYFKQSLLSSLLQIKKEYGFSCCDAFLKSLRSWNSDMPNSFGSLTSVWTKIRDGLMQSFFHWKEEKNSEDIRIFLDYLHEHIYEEDMSLSKMAITFHISESTVSRRIKAFTGYNFLDYVANKRITHACSLLAKTNMSVQEIAAATGYLNDVTFRRLFKKQIGITPSEYRQKYSK